MIFCLNVQIFGLGLILGLSKYYFWIKIDIFLRHQKHHVQNLPVKFLKQKGSKISAGGFVVNNNFEIAGLKNIYIPGILARGFNPERKTIIKAILENSNIAGQSIAKTLIRI